MECVLIGYTPHSKSYRCWQQSTGKVFDSINVVFVEHRDNAPRDLYPGRILGADTQLNPVLPIVPDDEPAQDAPMRTSRSPTVEAVEDEDDVSRLPLLDADDDVLLRRVDDSEPIRRSERLRARNSTNEAHLIEGESSPVSFAALASEMIDVHSPEDPVTYWEAMDSPARKEWVDATHVELDSLAAKDVYELIPRSAVPPGRKVLKGRLVYIRKHDELGNVNRHKVRYVVKGYEQIQGRDYTDTAAPTARLESFRTLLHLAAVNGWDAKQFDVKSAFCNGVLSDDETQYVEQAKHYEEPGKEDWVWKLLKALYGLKQSARVWNKTLHGAMAGWSFARLDCEWCIYWRHTDDGTVIVAVHVDDMLAVGDTAALASFKAELESRWDVSDLGDASFCLGI